MKVDPVCDPETSRETADSNDARMVQRYVTSSWLAADEEETVTTRGTGPA